MRTDSHRPGAIVPQDYEYLFWIDGGSGDEPSYGVNCMRPFFNWRTATSVPGAAKHQDEGMCCVLGLWAAGHKPADIGRDHGANQCTVCGTWFRFGAVWRHVPTGSIVFLGHDCADKYDLIARSMDKAQWNAYRKALAKQRTEAAKLHKKATARDAFIERNGLADAFGARTVEPPTEGWDPRRRSLEILNSLYNDLHRWGGLSEKQIELVRKLAGDIRKPLPETVEEVKTAAPTGRVEFEGTIVGVKWYDNEYGGSVKITVKVTTPNGIWLAWGTLPSAAEVPNRQDSSVQYNRGRTIKLRATLTQGNEPHFAFFKRPTLLSVSPV